MNKRRERKKYSHEFKLEALKLCEKRPVAEVAESLGLSPNLLFQWRKRLREKGEAGLGEIGKVLSLEDEVRNLRIENARLREEKEILKKAAAYFAKHLK